MPATVPRSTPAARWKGKARADPPAKRNEGDGGAGGVVLALDMVGGGFYEAVYTVPVSVGSSGQNLSLQVDTGSSDMWMASTACSSSACSNTKGRQYNMDSGSGRPTGVPFDITYLAGDVHGPIYWDTVNVGGYNIDSQAFAAATQVDSEPLENLFDGILGLALPLNSVIAQKLPPVTGNTPDGAAFTSNLFGMTPAASAPSARFLSLSLSRPDSDEIPSMLGIGRHPSQVVPDPSQIRYSTVQSQNSDGIFFWQSSVRAITVYVDGEAKPITIGRSNSGAVFPSAVLDSGVPYILTTTAIANGIYGAMGIGPASDGNYYLPCTTPINMTITLDGQSEMTLHPLDLTTVPLQDADSSNCVGLIQTANGQLDSPVSGLADMILGVPFLRNTYTVMAYDSPDANGVFPTHDNPSLLDDESLNSSIHPRLGLLGLTNATKALDEFHTVRVLQRPLSTGGGSGAQATTHDDGRHLSVGIEVLVGLLGFFALCVVLFVLRWFIVRRRYAKGAGAGPGMEERKSPLPGSDSDYELAQRGSLSDNMGYDDPRLSADAIAHMRAEEYLRRKKIGSSYTTDSVRTRVGSDVDTGEYGSRGLKKDDMNTLIGWGDTSLGSDAHSKRAESDSDPEDAPRAAHQHTSSDVGAPADGPSVAEPLLAHTRGDSRFDDAEFGIGARGSMAGVGTALRGSRISFDRRVSAVGSLGSARSGSVSPGHIRLPQPPLSPRFPGLASPEPERARPSSVHSNGSFELDGSGGRFER